MVSKTIIVGSIPATPAKLRLTLIYQRFFYIQITFDKERLVVDSEVKLWMYIGYIKINLNRKVDTIFSKYRFKKIC